jgi:hypothetical protein
MSRGSSTPSATEQGSAATAHFPGEFNAALNGKVASPSTSAKRRWSGLGRIVGFFCFTVVLLFGVNALINAGLHHIKTSQFGVSNKIVRGEINADVIISGSSRAVSHYDPRIIQETSGYNAFNIGRNGSQTDMQVAVLKTYLKHNRKPRLVLHNLDSFSFVTTTEVYDPAQYIPYLNETDLYAALHKIEGPVWWKSKNLPMYGYAVEDMRFNWVLGVKALLGRSPREDFFLGFNPRAGQWTEEFESFKSANTTGVSFAIEPAGVEVMNDLAGLCRDNGIKLIFVYSPEYRGMQALTKNRAEIFARFREISERYNVPIWDFSDWEHSDNRAYFRNSQHLNAEGAELFSADLARRLVAEFPQSKLAADASGLHLREGQKAELRK